MKKWLGIAFIVVFVVASFIAYRFYGFIYKDNVKPDQATELFIPTHSKFESLLDSMELHDLLNDKQSFVWVADKMKFRNIRSGKYIIHPDWNNKTLISNLRSGNQTATDVTFNNMRTIFELSKELADKLEPDSMAFINYFLDPANLKKVNLDSHNIMTLFIPNTYEFYWDASPKTVFSKMIREHDKFWNQERRRLLLEIGFTETEVYTIASIVQKETNLSSEKPTVAGLYINRLNKGINLQADPTVVFATGNFEMRRVLNRHIALDSPFNTYLNAGLPPGPICMPDISTIDAVLNYEKHDYLYMCALAEKPGAHAFAKTLAQHNQNARNYQEWLNQNKIYE